MYRSNKLKVISRRLETGGVVRIRANHLDSRVVSLTTFLTHRLGYGKDGVLVFEKSEDLPLFIFRVGKRIYFNFFEEPDRDTVFEISGKRYIISGYPQPTATMLSKDTFTNIFGDDPQELISVRVANLPSVKPDAILQRVEDFIKKYVGFFDTEGKLRKDMYRLIAYWILQTYIYDVWSKTSYLKIMGQAESGKSTLSRVIELLSFCSERSTAKVSDSWFYRNIDCVGGVQCLDELEVNKKEKGDFLELLKAGWSKSAMVHLSDKHDPNKSCSFNVFGPKLIAGTQAQYIDPVLSSRMIEVTMRPAPGNTDYSFEDLYDDEVMEETQEIRDSLYLFRLLYGPEYLGRKSMEAKDKASMKKVDNEISLSNRQLDLFSPLLTIANYHGGRGPKKVLKKAIAEQVKIKRIEFFESFDLPILRVIWEGTRDVKREWLSAKAIADTVVQQLAGSDPTTQRYVRSQYDYRTVEAHLKGLGLTRETKYDLRGPRHLFVQEDVDRFLRNKGVSTGLEPEDLSNKLKDLMKLLNDFSKEQDYEEFGVPVSVIKQELEYDPKLQLNLLLDRGHVVVLRGNRWLPLVEM
jgi:hypothetical protein